MRRYAEPYQPISSSVLKRSVILRRNTQQVSDSDKGETHFGIDSCVVLHGFRVSVRQGQDERVEWTAFLQEPCKRQLDTMQS